MLQNLAEQEALAQLRCEHPCVRRHQATSLPTEPPIAASQGLLQIAPVGHQTASWMEALARAIPKVLVLSPCTSLYGDRQVLSQIAPTDAQGQNTAVTCSPDQPTMSSTSLERFRAQTATTPAQLTASVGTGAGDDFLIDPQAEASVHQHSDPLTHDILAANQAPVAMQSADLDDQQPSIAKVTEPAPTKFELATSEVQISAVAELK